MGPHYNKEFGLALRKICLTAKMSQDRLAMLADLDRSHISVLARGKRSPTLETMLSFYKGLNVSLPILATAIADTIYEAEIKRSER